MTTSTEKIWRPFIVGELFRLEPGKAKGLNHLEQDERGIPYLGATNRNNAVLAFVRPVEKLIQRGNCIAFIRNGEGSVGYSVYKQEDFIATSDITCGYADFLNKYVGLFITTVADKVRGKYNFNYKRSDTRLKKERLMLPVNDDGSPDFVFMESYVRAIEEKLLQRYRDFAQEKLSELGNGGGCISLPPLNEKRWAEFLFTDVFRIEKGFYNKKPTASGAGKIPFLGATENNNGITEFYTYDEIANASKVGYGKNESIDRKIFEGNAIAVTNNGSVGHAFYQPTPFTCSHDINPLYLKNYQLNESIALFLIDCIEKQGICFAYARKWRPIRMINSKIFLPVNDEGAPDFEYMEAYAKNLEAEKYRKYLAYIGDD